MYSLSFPAYTELAFVTSRVLTLSVPVLGDIKFILQGVVGTTRPTRQRHPSYPPPTLICNNALNFSWNHSHMWRSRRCRWEWSYTTLAMTDVNLLPGAEGATGPGWQLVLNAGIVSQARSSDQTQRRWMGSASLPWHRIIQLTKGPDCRTSVLVAVQEQWPGGHGEPNFYFDIEELTKRLHATKLKDDWWYNKQHILLHSRLWYQAMSYF